MAAAALVQWVRMRRLLVTWASAGNSEDWWKSGDAFQQLEIWSELLVSSVLRGTTWYHQGGVWLTPVTLNTEPRSWGTILAWDTQSPDHRGVCLEFHERKKVFAWFSKMFGTTDQPSFFNNGAKVFTPSRSIWCCLEGRRCSEQILIPFRLLFWSFNKLMIEIHF